jgi:hypothetical protein
MDRDDYGGLGIQILQWKKKERKMRRINYSNNNLESIVPWMQGKTLVLVRLFITVTKHLRK